jgi:hypothetical protein
MATPGLTSLTLYPLSNYKIGQKVLPGKRFFDSVFVTYRSGPMGRPSGRLGSFVEEELLGMANAVKSLLLRTAVVSYGMK